MFELGITEHWWDVAKRYPELSNHQYTLKPLGYAFIVELIEAFKPKRVLEVGHGSGSFLFNIFKNKLELWGLDDEVKDSSVSPEDLENVKLWHPEVKFVKGLLGTNNTQLPDNYFDLVFSVSVVEHIPEEILPNVFQDAYRILKPGGIMAHSYDVYFGQSTKNLFDAYGKAKFEWLKHKDTMNVFWEKWLCDDGSKIPFSLFEKIMTENPMFVSEVYMWQQERSRRQAPMNFFTILNAGKKPLDNPVDEIKYDEIKISPENFDNFTYSKKKHFDFFSSNNFDEDLYKKRIEAEYSDIKSYQELLVYSFIKHNIPPGSKILELGGNYPLVLKRLKSDYECWNLHSSDVALNQMNDTDKEGIKFLKNNIENLNDELPENYFDFIFSISALNDNESANQTILDNINRLLKKGGYSLLTFVLLLTEHNRIWSNKFIPFLYDNEKIINENIHVFKIQIDNDLHLMSEKFYNDNWKEMTKKDYGKFGKPLSYNVLWKKH